VLIYTKPDTFKETSIAVQDLANIQAQGAVVSQTRRYPGITSDNLAARLAMRDLASVSTPLAKVRLKVNRKAWNLYPGDVFKLEWPALGIAGLVMRIAGVDGGSLTNGAISIDAVEDVFGLPSAVYTASQPTGWTDPVPAPSATTPRVWSKRRTGTWPAHSLHRSSPTSMPPTVSCRPWAAAPRQGR